MAIDEAKLFKAFGLEQPAGENGQGAAAPADAVNTPDETGENGQGIAAPAADGGTAAGTDPTGNGEGGPGTGGEMTKEQRSANAARRRQQEQQAAIDAAVQAEQQKNQAVLEDIFKRAGLINTVTGEPIKTVDDFNGWHKAFTEKRIQKDLKDGKLTPEAIAQAVAENPLLKQVEQLLADRENTAKAQQEEADNARISQEMEAISKREPGVKVPADLLKLPEAARIRELVNQGYSFDHAHLIATYDRLEAGRSTAARQAAQEAARGKEHLRGAGNSRGDGAAAVPGDVMRYYRKFLPNATDAQIQAHYNKTIKGGK